MTTERILAQLGWLVAALILIGFLVGERITDRLNWLQFGHQYEANQQALVKDVSGALQQLDARLRVLEPQKAAAPPAK